MRHLRRTLFVLLLSAPFALPALGCGGRTYSSAEVAYRVSSPPPPSRRIQPRHRSGYVWVPGRWLRYGDRWVWRDGYWVQRRPGYALVPGRWVQRGRHWVWVEPHWVRRDTARRAPRVRDHRRYR